MPDALIIASARVADADVLITSDRTWQTRVADIVGGIEILGLPD